jgi:hypothetical protein
VSKPLDRQVKSSFKKVAIDMITAKLESAEYVITPREEIIYIIELDMIIKIERAKMDKLRKAFMCMRHGRKDGF